MYVGECSRKYLQSYKLGKKQWKVLEFDSKVLANSTQAWNQYLDSIGIVTPLAVRLVTEAALLGGLIEGGVSQKLVILSDGAGQFNLLVHALCWVHAERAIRKLEGSTAVFRQNIEEVQTLLWDYYQELKTYPKTPSDQYKKYLWARFDEVFGRCYLQHPTLNNTLMGFRKNKKQLLRVLDDPDIPLHNNAAESDIREFVTRRKISGGT
ncbi:MAG: transposase, partial [Moorea sp. SIO4A1]|uniref:IS66 family transposase n=1 Tax=Moorena sp. SIO4A1 TaxID=2607835 RepID=UPI00145007B2